MKIVRWTRNNQCLFSAICLILLFGIGGGEGSARDIPSVVQELLERPKVKGTYVPLTSHEFSRTVNLFAKTFAHERPEILKKDWAELGFDALEVGVDEDKLLVLRPNGTKAHHRGVYVFRRNVDTPGVLQMPHRFHDYHTGVIGARFFMESRCRAMAFNTAHRSVVDMAREIGSSFQAFTEAWGRMDSNGLLVQLHGFNAKGRVSKGGDSVEMILSNGTSRPDSWLLQVSSCLRELNFDDTCVYPDDIQVLGGTRNISGRTLRGLRRGKFLHVEMALPVRKTLRGDRMIRETFFGCIFDSVGVQ